MKRLLRPPLRQDVETKTGLINTVRALAIWAEQVSWAINNLVSNVPADSTASDVASVVADLNSLQDIIRDLDVR